MSETRATVSKRRWSAASLCRGRECRRVCAARVSRHICRRRDRGWGVFVSLDQNHLVKTGRHDVDQIHVERELLMLLVRDFAGDKDAEMADALVQRINDRLPIRDQIVDVIVKIEDPIERLLRRRDVVAERAEDDDRRLILRRSMRSPSRVRRSPPLASLFPTNNSSTMNWISSALEEPESPTISRIRETVSPPCRHWRKRYSSFSRTCSPGCWTRNWKPAQAPSKMPLPRSPCSDVSQVPPSMPPR